MSQPAITRCVHLLEVMANDASSLSVAEVAERLRTSPRKARVLLDLVAQRGYAKHAASDERYRLTMKLPQLALAYAAHSRISEVFQPILDRLAAFTGELVRLALAEGGRLTWVGKAQGSRSGLRFDAETGREVALHSTAAGKAWLAALPLDAALKHVAERGFGGKDEFGPKAIRSVERLSQELKQTARRRYAVGHHEYILGISAIAMAVPARSAADAPMGAVSIAGPSTRLTREKLESFCPTLERATRELSALLPLGGDRFDVVRIRNNEGGRR